MSLIIRFIGTITIYELNYIYSIIYITSLLSTNFNKIQYIYCLLSNLLITIYNNVEVRSVFIKSIS